MVGTLISPTKILTNSHFIGHIPENPLVVFSLPSLNNGENPALLEVDATNIVVHPHRILKETHIPVYDTFGNNDQTWDTTFRDLPTPDLSILTLKNAIPSVEPFKNILLEEPRQDFSNGYVVSTYPPRLFQQRPIMARASSPQKAHVGIIKIAKDPSTHSLFTAFDIRYYAQQTFPKLSVLTGQGDSGAPLIVKHEGVLKIAGLCSGGSYQYGAHYDGQHSVFTPIYPYGDWIKEQLQK